jgi:hypothetical protein
VRISFGRSLISDNFRTESGVHPPPPDKPIANHAPYPPSAAILTTGTTLFGALKFLWNATRGHRLAPWRSEFLRWRVETYSGKPAETLRTRDIFGFMWASKWELLNFLLWTGQVQKEARRRP